METTKVPTRRERYAHQEIEQKWRDAWDAARLYELNDDNPNPKWYAVTMYPYPSGDLHIGHWYAMTPSDTAARYKRLRGYNVFFPMGFDAFGLPAENAAIKRGAHPYKWTMANIENMRRQMRTMGTMFDWSHSVVTCDPDYYKWNQWFFLKFMEHDLAYRKEQAVWWCPTDQTVLANEQVVDGKCERCGTEVYQQQMEQWFFRITKYAEELLNYDEIEWPERVRTMQRNWIGRSEGARVTFETETGDPIEVFTTRPDTLWGATFMVLAPEHPLVAKLTTDEQRAEVEAYIDQARRETEIERQATDKEKTGVFTGGYAINPVNGEKIPVWIADYVLVTYGTGAIMAVPAHDERDYEFALKFGLPIVPVIEHPDRQIRAVIPGGSFKDRDGIQQALEDEGISFTIDEGEDFYVTLTTDQFDTFVDIVRSKANGGDPEVGTVDEAWCSYAGARTGWIFGDGAIELDSVEADRRIVERVDGGPGRTAMQILRFEDTPRPFMTAEPDVTFHHEYGTMINSGELTGTPGDVAVQKTIEWLEARGIGKGEVNYRMRDWLISRQRYWGTPIPIIYCDTCGIVPVPYEDLPVVLPQDSKFTPSGKSPLQDDAEFLNVACPSCGGPARREADTLDTFMDSSWYWYRYLNPDYQDGPFDPSMKHWVPVDQYTGGIEHATMHLLYARFFTKAMRDMGMVDFDEPFLRLFNQGIILGEDSEKMSKSRGNVVDPDDLVHEYGADTVRLFLMFLGPWDQGGPWNSRGIAGPQRFLERAFAVVTETAENAAEPRDDDATRDLRRVTHQTIGGVTKDIEGFAFNTAIAKLMEFVNELMKAKDTPVAETAAWREATESLTLMLAPFAPHAAEELWSRLGKPFSVHNQSWPTWDESLAAVETVEVAVQVNGKVRDRITLAADATDADALAAGRASAKAQEYLTGKQVVKEIYVPGRLISFVVR